MSLTRSNGELRVQIDAPVPRLEEADDPTKNDHNPGITNFDNVSPAPPPIPQESQTAAPCQQGNQQSPSVTCSINLPPDPPPYSDLPIYTIPLSSPIYDPPPPYDPTMRRETFDPSDFPYQSYQPSRTSRFECKPDTLVPLGFCYCTLEQLIVTMAILGTFVFLGLGQFS